MSSLSDLKSAQGKIEGFAFSVLFGTAGLSVAIGDALEPPPPKGSPDSVEQVAATYSQASTTCGSTAGEIKGVGSDTLPSAWKGGVAENASQAVTAVSSEVTHMQDALSRAADALNTWARELRWALQTDQQGVAQLKKAKDDIGWGGIDILGAASAKREASAGVDLRVAAAEHAQSAASRATSTLNQLASLARAERVLSGDVDALSSVELANSVNPGGSEGVDAGNILTDTQLSRGSKQLDHMSPADRAAFEKMLADSNSPQESAYLWKAMAAGHTMTDLRSFQAAIHPHGGDPAWLAVHLTPALTTQDGLNQDGSQHHLSYQGSNSSGGYDMYSQRNVGDCVAASTVAAQLSMDPALMLKMTTGGTADGDDSPDAFHQRLNDLYVSEYQRGQQADGQSGTFPKVDSGLGSKGETALAQSDLGSVDGGDYSYSSLNDSGDRSAALGGIEQAVDSGKPVPIDAKADDGGAHQMMIIGRDGDKLEIYNPWGYTEWVSESDFVDGRIGTLTSDSPTGGEHTVYGVEIPK